MTNPAATILREFSGAWACAEFIGENDHIDWPRIMQRYPMLSGGEQAIVALARCIDENWLAFDSKHQAIVVNALQETLAGVR